MPARIAHFEIQGPNDELTAAFYRDLLDWPATLAALATR